MHRALALVALLSFSAAFAACPVAVQNQPTDAANKLAVKKLGALLACDPNDPINDQSPCNTFASKGLEAIYGVTDFKTAAGTHQSANEIHATVKKSTRWKEIGAVLDDDNALCAQSAANAALPVIAVITGSPHGHIALIIPGEPFKSPTWGKFAPKSASFFYNSPGKGYVNEPLSKAFQPAEAKNTTYYYRSPS